MKITLTQWNILANLAGQGSYALLTFFVTPIFVALLGVEAYGIVGVFATVQAMLAFLDLGLGAAVNRELAILSGEERSAATMRATVRRVEIFYWIMSFTLGVALALSAPLLADHWLRAETMSRDDLVDALRLMALVLCVQWPAFLYAGCLTGLQRHAALNLAMLAASLVRFPLTALLLFAFAPTLAVFFVGQSLAALVHTFANAYSTRRYLPAAEETPPAIHWRRLRGYAGGYFRNSVIAMGLASLDKVILTRLVPLDEFGAYMLAFALASGLGIVSQPIYVAVFPRFAQMAGGAGDALATLYHQAAQLQSALLFPLALPLAFFPEAALLVWTGNADIAASAGPILRLLVLSMTLTCLVWIPQALQYAHGWTNLIFYANVAFALAYAPACYLFARDFGGVGAAGAALALTACSLLVVVPLMHRRLLAGEFWRWCAIDIAVPLAPCAVICTILVFAYVPAGRLDSLALLAGAWLLCILAAVAVTPVTRRWLLAHRSPA